eukprot:TRINITY_DN11471_c1_g1_i1.p1 TRINITY_DN11471_c1_g1~~TRINITY_DN11471_c1_g1_i1.p1  ORF type:complete len:227 (-),score=66.64 TRINITY_DN11471_c1_g1_i1:385-1065(-)
MDAQLLNLTRQVNNGSEFDSKKEFGNKAEPDKVQFMGAQQLDLTKQAILADMERMIAESGNEVDNANEQFGRGYDSEFDHDYELGGDYEPGIMQFDTEQFGVESDSAGEALGASHCVEKTTLLTLSNQEIDDVINVVQSLRMKTSSAGLQGKSRRLASSSCHYGHASRTLPPRLGKNFVTPPPRLQRHPFALREAPASSGTSQQTTRQRPSSDSPPTTCSPEPELY